MIGIKYISCFYDHSGYGEAARSYALSLYKNGVPITLQLVSFEQNPPPIANKEDKDIIDSLINKSIKYDVVIIQLTPDLYPRYVEPGKYNIGYFAWETTLLHPQWLAALGCVNEVWVPCDWNVKTIEESGLDKPVFKIPHGIDTAMFDNPDENKFAISGLSKDTYKFYSIFQWTNRKNPEGLIRSYFNSFDQNDDVVLILKAYLGGNVLKDKEFISERIAYIKKDMGVGGYPKIVVVVDKLSRSQMTGLHLYGDCCVSLHRGEGWGLVPFEAGLAGNPVIATGYSGNTEFMNKENSYLVDYQETFVSDMSGFNKWYFSSGCWAEPNLISASHWMQHVESNKEEAMLKGSRLKHNILSNFSFDAVSDIITKRISEI